MTDLFIFMYYFLITICRGLASIAHAVYIPEGKCQRRIQNPVNISKMEHFMKIFNG